MATQAASAPPADTAMPSTILCAVCDRRRPALVDGKRVYTQSPNGNRTCFACVDAQDRDRMEKEGKISLAIELADGQLVAVNPTGHLRFPLLPPHEGANVGQMIGNPRFADKKLGTWLGRFYPQSGTAHFQRSKQEEQKGATGPAAKRPLAGGAADAKKGGRMGKEPRRAKATRGAEKPDAAAQAATA